MLNNISLQGRLVANPELKATTSGKHVCRFSIANSQKGANGEEKTDFIDCVAWNKTAEFLCNHFTKGKEILLTGRLSTRNYENTDGKSVKVVEVVVNTIDFCGAKKETAEPTPAPAVVEETDVQLPFSLVD